MSKWKLTTESPKKSGEYYVITRINTSYGYKYSRPSTMLFGKMFDSWNSYDHVIDGNKNRIPDLRDATDELYHSYVFAWREIEPLTAEEIAELEKEVSA